MERTSFLLRSQVPLRCSCATSSRVKTRRRLHLRVRNDPTDWRLRSVLQSQSNTEDVYVGDGRVIQDDPSKYPSKEDAGPIQGATGGWAGGEPGLKKFLENVEREMESSVSEMEENSREPKRIGEGDDKIYVGFDYRNPDDVTARRKGESGNFIIDNKAKYPGGFAGGEIGLKKFLEEGDIQIAGPNERGRSQMSPLVIGIFIATVATTGGLLLTDAIDFGEKLSFNISAAQLDDKTKVLLEVALGLLALAWGGSAALAAFKTWREKIMSGTMSLSRVAVTVAFWCVVLIATYNLAKL